RSLRSAISTRHSAPGYGRPDFIPGREQIQIRRAVGTLPNSVDRSSAAAVPHRPDADARRYAGRIAEGVGKSVVPSRDDGRNPYGLQLIDLGFERRALFRIAGALEHAGDVGHQAYVHRGDAVLTSQVVINVLEGGHDVGCS